MCKLTIVLYTQCNHGPQDGSDGEGFIVTKKWQRRLPIDLEEVPFERCTQAKNFVLRSTPSNTMEFRRCYNVQVKTIRFKEEPCFRCFTYREMKKRTERIKALYAEHKVLSRRFDTLKKTEIKDTEFTWEIRQTLKTASQHERMTKIENYNGVKNELCSAVLESSAGEEANWEDGLRKHLAGWKMAKAKRSEKTVESTSEEKKIKNQGKLASLKHCLARVNQQTAAPSMEEVEGPPPYEETERTLSIQRQPPQRIRIARTSRNVLSGIGPRLDIMVPIRVMQDMREAGLAQNTSASVTNCSSVITAAQTRSDAILRNSMTSHHATSRITAAGVVPVGAASLSDTELATSQYFTIASAKAPVFKPFQKQPPTEPRMMRAPIAPRAMREGGFPQATWQPRRSYATFGGNMAYRSWQW